uniref:Uncharacterized protein n=1 Tax=Panagrolaimus sp. ES5 TaxID=591445 RepID=A0AC34F4C0_9BILA
MSSVTATLLTNTTILTTTSHPEDTFDPIAITVEVVGGILALILWAILRWCVFRKVLKENPGGPTDIHIQTNAEIKNQQNEFSKNGGQPNQQRISREQHEKNMKKIRKVLGDEDAAKLEKELDARGLELDADAVDNALKKGGPDVAKIMMRERCGFNDAVKIAIKEQAMVAMKDDPEMAEKLRNDPELAQQALDAGVVSKSQLEKIQEEGGQQPTTSPAAESPAANN